MILNVKKGPVCAGPFLYQKTTGFSRKKPVETFLSRSWQLR